MYKLIIAGGRDFTNSKQLVETINHLESKNIFTTDNLEIVSGMANGADKMGYVIAKTNNLPVKEFPADWNTYGKRAGFLRNNQMGDYADGLLAFWDGKSRGTKHMIDYMRSLNKPVFIEYY